MQTLGNMIFGAVLASLSLAPTAWADAQQLIGTPLSAAAATITRTGQAPAALEHAARAVWGRLPNSARLHN